MVGVTPEGNADTLLRREDDTTDAPAVSMEDIDVALDERRGLAVDDILAEGPCPPGLKFTLGVAPAAPRTAVVFRSMVEGVDGIGTGAWPSGGNTLSSGLGEGGNMKSVWCGVAEPMTFNCGGRDTCGRRMRSFLFAVGATVLCSRLPTQADVKDDNDTLEDWLSERLASDGVAMISMDSDLACARIRRGAGLLFFSVVRGTLLMLASCS